jgi:hypothetical protein
LRGPARPRRQRDTFWRDRPAPRRPGSGTACTQPLGHERLADEMFVDIRDAWAEHRSAPVAGTR